MSPTSRPGRIFTALLLLVLALLPSRALGSRCDACPQPRAAVSHSCCHPSAQAPGEDPGTWSPPCCGRSEAPRALPERETKMTPGAPAVDVLPADEAHLPSPKTVSGRI